MSAIEVAALIAAAIHIPLALTVWSLLHRRWARQPLGLWVAGSLALGAGATLFAAQDLVPRWAGNELGNALLSLAPALRIAALRLDLGRPVRAAWLAALCLLDFGLYLFSLHHLGEERRLLLGFASMTSWAAAFAWHAGVIGRQFRSRSGVTLAVFEGLFACALAVHVGAMATGWTSARGITSDWDFEMLVATGLAAALYGNLGYLGLVLDRTSSAERAARTAQQAEAQARALAERGSSELRASLRQRDRLLQMLAHEIRQPLHNASSALHSAARTLASSRPEGEADAAIAQTMSHTEARLTHARDVLLGVQSMLDNTLTAATQLSQQALPVRVSTELDFLVRLSLGDLPDEQHARVRVNWHGGMRSVELEPGLVRLALRNLLLNAFRHGGPAVQVRLDVDEQADPSALMLRVSDDGPGAPAHVLQAAVDEREDLRFIGGRRSEGLAIVRQVMEMHAGELRLQPAHPHGLVATLVFPQPG